MTAHDLRISNASMAIGRIGVAIILVPILWVMAFLLVVSEEPGKAVAFGLFLLLLGAVLAWAAFRVPLSVAFIGDAFVVRYLIGTSIVDVGDVVGVTTGFMWSTIGPGSRRYPHVTFILRNGRRIQIKADHGTVAVVQSRVPHLRDDTAVRPTPYPRRIVSENAGRDPTTHGFDAPRGTEGGSPR
jgi:hypothetical protein